MPGHLSEIVGQLLGDALVFVTTKPSFRLEPPRVVFDGSFFTGGDIGGAQFDVSPDGKRLLVLKSVGPDAADDEHGQLVLVQNWFQELTRLVPAND